MARGPRHCGVGEARRVVCEGPALGGVHGKDGGHHVELSLSLVGATPSCVRISTGKKNNRENGTLNYWSINFGDLVTVKGCFVVINGTFLFIHNRKVVSAVDIKNGIIHELVIRDSTS